MGVNVLVIVTVGVRDGVCEGVIVCDGVSEAVGVREGVLLGV